MLSKLLCKLESLYVHIKHFHIKLKYLYSRAFIFILLLDIILNMNPQEAITGYEKLLKEGKVR
jgi:hypothetical protein